MRFSYATVALPTLTPLEAIRQLAECGYDGVEWRVGSTPRRDRPSSAERFLRNNRCTLTPYSHDLREIAAECRSFGLTVVGLGPYLDVNRRDELAPLIALAHQFDARQIRLLAPRTDQGPFEYKNLAGQTVAFLRAAEPVLRGHGVRIVIEMHHHTIAPSAALALRLVESFDPDVVGVIYDTGNVIWEGYEDPELALQILGPYLHHVHLKNASVEGGPDGESRSRRCVWAPLESGMVNVADLLSRLRVHGYDGWVSLEDLSTVRDPLETMRHNARVLKSMPAARWPGRRRRSAT